MTCCFALEVGGRWSPEASQFVRLLARCRARAVPRPLRPATIAAFTSRWSALLAFSAARDFGASLLGLSLPGTANVDGDQPLLSEVLASTRYGSARCQNGGKQRGMEDQKKNLKWIKNKFRLNRSKKIEKGSKTNLRLGDLLQKTARLLGIADQKIFLKDQKQIYGWGICGGRVFLKVWPNGFFLRFGRTFG